MNTSNTSPSLRFVDAETVARNLPFAELIEALRRAFAATDLTAPARNHYGLDGLASGRPVLLSMPAWSGRLGIGAKLVTVYPDNHKLGLPSIHGLYVLMDASTGRPEAVFDAGELTARRTAAASALASRYLSRPDSRTLLMVGRVGSSRIQLVSQSYSPNNLRMCRPDSSSPVTPTTRTSHPSTERLAATLPAPPTALRS